MIKNVDFPKHRKVTVPILHYDTTDMKGSCGWFTQDQNGALYQTTVLDGISDYSEFPATTYYIQKYGIHPSTIKYSCILDYKAFFERIESLEKGFCFYNERDERKNANEDYKFKKFFVCFESIEHKCILYIIVSEKFNGQLVLDNLEDGHKMFDVLCIYNPTVSSDDILKIVKKEIISLPEYNLNSNFSGNLNILTKDSSGYKMQTSKISCPEVDFNINYNEDFNNIHSLILEKLSVNNSKGLVILHGDPGTGKTTYIRWLINNLNKKVIYVPPNMSDAISDPELIRFFLLQQNSIFIIEDAESILSKRVGGLSQAVSNILNLTDGLLSDCVNIQVVATLNMDISNIDEALLRKGRLIAKYEFKPLSADRTKLLAEKLGVEINESHNLADIYNYR